MNNTQFRRLVLDTPARPKSDGGIASGTPRQGGATPSALGSRMRASIPMTPRSVAGSSTNDFARQLAERNAELNPPQTKKFRSSAAPKGSKLASGYQDRTQLRTSIEEDDKAKRVKALEDMVKLGQMDRVTFEKLRDEIVGGDVNDVHLVKGLDYKLLERVKKGEDVLAQQLKAEVGSAEGGKDEPDVNVDDEFEKLEDQEIMPRAKEEKSKRGEMAPPSVAGKKRTRDEILRELRASRMAAAAEAKARQPALGARFKKVGEKREQSRIERDERGREVLITVDADGHVKKKVKKVKVEENAAKSNGLMMPDKDVAPLGMDVVPAAPALAAPVDDGNIFEGVGTDYNLLGDAEENDDDDPEESADEAAESKEPRIAKEAARSPTSHGNQSSMPPPAVPPTAAPRNYFNEPNDDDSATKGTVQNPLQDPTMLAALKKASSIAPISSRTDATAAGDAEAAKLVRHQKILESHDRDADDLDMGFGSSRFGDEEDAEEGGKFKLSAWGADGGDEEGAGGKGGGKEKRKRGRKRKKKEGDVNNAADVMKVLERKQGVARR
ncbi:MAG: hypothetical protein Q9163_005810 [Psora crenata]